MAVTSSDTPRTPDTLGVGRVGRGTEPPQGRLVRFAKAAVAPLILLVLLLALWQWLVDSDTVSRIILSSPTEIGSSLGSLVTSPGFAGNLGITAYEAAFGSVLGLSLGLLLGVISSASRFLNRTFYPYVVFFQGLPKVVLAPLFVTWFGFGAASKIVMVVVITFFPIYVNTLLGLNSYDQDALKLLRSYRATRKQIFLRLQVPSALPSIFAGAKTSLSFALVGTIVAEFLGASRGLGYLILQYNFVLKTDRVFALIVILAVMGLIVYLGVEWVYRKVVFWENHDLLL
jgi:NitT/TauT family transport system permease protein